MSLCSWVIVPTRPVALHFVLWCSSACRGASPRTHHPKVHLKEPQKKKKPVKSPRTLIYTLRTGQRTMLHRNQSLPLVFRVRHSHWPRLHLHPDVTLSAKPSERFHSSLRRATGLTFRQRGGSVHRSSLLMQASWSVADCSPGSAVVAANQQGGTIEMFMHTCAQQQ